MMNNNHKNSGCGFAEELVSYIYGESDAAAKSTFEAHLGSCSVCEDELKAFSGVHFSITDWKSKEFAELPMPVIEIPYPITVHKQEVSGQTGSWLPAFVRDFFSLSPRSLSLAAASVAILAVVGAVVWFGLTSRTGGDLAESNKIVKPVVVPTIEKSPEKANSNSNQNDLPVKESIPSPQQPQPATAIEQSTKNNRAVKISNNPRPAQKTETTTSPKNNDMKRNNKKNHEVPPSVIPDEDEDDTLRLAELFEEIDAKE